MWPMLAMAGASMLMQTQARKEQMKRQKRTANASADAIRASWMRKDGRGQIPQTQFAPGSAWGGMMRAGMGGAMQGAMIGNAMGGGAASPAGGMGLEAAGSGGGGMVGSGVYGGNAGAGMVGEGASAFSQAPSSAFNYRPQGINYGAMRGYGA